jgi:malate permease and related proteins
MLIWNVFTKVCLPIFVLMSFGWLLDRRFRLDIGSLVKLNIYLFVPAFIFVQIISSPLRVGMALRVMTFTLCIIVGMFAMSALAARIGGYSAV